jgi:hypothetical protein
MVNSLAFCAQAVLTETQRTPAQEDAAPAPPPFDRAEIETFLRGNRDQIAAAGGFEEVAAALDELLLLEHTDLEALEQRLSVLEQKMIAIARAKESEEESLMARRELEAQLQPYRRKMSGPQLAMLERQFLERRLLAAAGLPRLSLFYLR